VTSALVSVTSDITANNITRHNENSHVALSSDSVVSGHGLGLLDFARCYEVNG